MTAGQPRRQATEPGYRTPLVVLGCVVSTLLAAFFVAVGHSAAQGVRAGQAMAAASAKHVAGPGEGAHRDSGQGRRAVQGPPVPAAATARVHVCSAVEHGGGRGSGCTGASDSGGDATLPGPPAQPAPAASLIAPPPSSALARGLSGPLSGSDLAPDLHLLQVQRI